MDEQERMVLRRRRQDIAEAVSMTTEFLNNLHENGLLTDDAMAIIQSEKSNLNKTSRMTDFMTSQTIIDGFEKFCRVLSKTNKKLARELEMDLRLERGDVQPSQELFDEAAVLVHRKFGPSKRFSELDKREVADLIAMKLQLTHDEWKKEADKVRKELEEVRSEIQIKDERSLRIHGFMRDFARKHERQLTNHAHDLTTTRELLKKLLEVPQSDILVALQNHMTDFFHQVEMMLDHRDALYYEKEKCLKMLGVEDESAQLDEVVGKFTGLSINPDMSVEDKDLTITKLKRQLDELEVEADQLEADVNLYKKQLADKDREISELRHNIHIS